MSIRGAAVAFGVIRVTRRMREGARGGRRRSPGPPPLGPAIVDALDAFVARRKREIASDA